MGNGTTNNMNNNNMNNNNINNNNIINDTNPDTNNCRNKRANNMNNSTKCALVVANDFLRRNRDKMSDEEAHALRVLIAAAAQAPDQEPATWHCDTYCRKIRHASCEGEFGAENTSPNVCPYLEEMLY